MTQAFQKMGHELTIVSPSATEKEDFGGESKSLGILKKVIPLWLYELLEFGYTIVDFSKLLIAAIKFKPDIIYERYNIFLPSGIFVKKLLKLPLLLEVNAPLFDEKSKYGGVSLKSLAKWSEGYVWREADHVFSVTDVLADYIRAEHVPNDRITITHNGVNLEKFELVKDKNQAKANIGCEGHLVLGFTGFIRKWHGLHRVIEIIANNPQIDCIFYVIGDGPAKDELVELSKEKQLTDKIKFEGLIDRDNIYKFVSAFDIALQPDVVPYASPLKMFEYMACGCSIVAPNTNNIKEILTHEKDGLLFEINDAGSFEKTIEELIKNEPLVKKLADNAREKIISTPYTWQYNAKVVTDKAKKFIS